MRSETLSYLCSKKHLRICSVEAAVVFFDCIGGAVGDVKHMTLVQPMRLTQQISAKQTEQFFHLMAQATSLSYLKLELNTVFPPCRELHVSEPDWNVWQEMVKFLEKRNDLGFYWGVAGDDPKIKVRGRDVAESARLSDLFGADRKANFWFNKTWEGKKRSL
jgi:hypothetical protein